jgi:cytoskeletal protein CcmA (bactofilin family)
MKWGTGSDEKIPTVRSHADTRAGSAGLSVVGVERPTTVAAQTVIVGTLDTKGSVVVEGEFQGDITCAGKVYIAQTGVVRGTIKASELQIEGTLQGEALIIKSFYLGKTGRMQGDVTTHSIVVEAGASLIGRCTMPTESEVARVNEAVGNL